MGAYTVDPDYGEVKFKNWREVPCFNPRTHRWDMRWCATVVSGEIDRPATGSEQLEAEDGDSSPPSSGKREATKRKIQRIIDYLRENGPSETKQIAGALDLGPSSVYSICREEGSIQHMGRSGKGRTVFGLHDQEFIRRDFNECALAIRELLRDRGKMGTGDIGRALDFPPTTIRKTLQRHEGVMFEAVGEITINPKVKSPIWDLTAEYR